MAPFFGRESHGPETFSGIFKSTQLPNVAKLGPEPTPSDPNVSCFSITFGEKISVLFFEGYIRFLWMGKSLHHELLLKVLTELSSGEGWRPS